MAEYAGIGIRHYWIVDHRPAPRIQVLTLADQGYVAAPAVGAGSVLVAEIEADKPSEVSFDPAVLLEF